MVSIIYPQLVEQSYGFMLAQGIKVSKDEIYKQLVAQNMIDELGNPTKFALENGLISDFTESDGMSLLEFKEMYPIFKKYTRDHFMYEEKRWYIDGVILGDVTEMNDVDKDQANQLRSYFEQRNYEQPSTFAENKAVFYPMYEPYEKEQFTFRDGLMLVPESITKDIGHRILNGELNGNMEKAQEMLNRLC